MQQRRSKAFSFHDKNNEKQGEGKRPSFSDTDTNVTRNDIVFFFFRVIFTVMLFCTVMIFLYFVFADETLFVACTGFSMHNKAASRRALLSVYDGSLSFLN